MESVQVFVKNGSVHEEVPGDGTNGMKVQLAGGSEAFIGQTGIPIVTPSANFTRPADVTAYTSGDLVANSTAAGSVVPMSWSCARVAAGSFLVRGARLKKTSTTTGNANFRLHLFSVSPTVGAGDNSTLSVTNAAGFLGTITLDASVVGLAVTGESGGAVVRGAPSHGQEINVKLASGQTIYGLMIANAGYVPGNGETFTVELEIQQN